MAKSSLGTSGQEAERKGIFLRLASSHWAPPIKTLPLPNKATGRRPSLQHVGLLTNPNGSTYDVHEGYTLLSFIFW